MSTFAEPIARIVKAAVELCAKVESVAHIVVRLLAMAIGFLCFVLVDCSTGFILQTAMLMQSKSSPLFIDLRRTRSK